VKLYAHNRVFPVPERHDLSLSGSGGNFQIIWEAFPSDNQGVITGGFERFGNIFKERIAIMLYGRCLAMHQAGCSDDPAAKDFANTLVTEADTQRWNAQPDTADDLTGDPRIRWIAWTWRDDNMGGLQGFNFLGSDGIVAKNTYFRP
jgi:hypothetical protein